MRFSYAKNASGPKRVLLYTLPASVAVLAVCLVALILVQFVFGSGSGSGNNPSGTPGGNEQPSGNGNVVYTMIPVASSDIYSKGALLIVNTKTMIRSYPSDDQLVTIYGENKTASYKVNISSFRLNGEALDAFNAMMDAYCLETGNASITVTSAYRTEADQAALTSSSVQAGYSDHHLALSLALKNPDSRADLDNPDHWLYQNGYKFGYIQRYPVGKEDSTLDTQKYYNCVRYVGIPHATYIYENNLSLEEYVTLVKGYTYDGTHLTVTANGASYEIYYVAATNLTDENGLTQLPVPESLEYSYSGNNTDGFIVTVKVG